MSTPSAYLANSLSRWNDRGTLLRRDVEIMMDGMEVKVHFMEGLRTKIAEHRHEDSAQLATARKETWSQWDVRLNRLQQWIGSVDSLARTSGQHFEWRNSARWFERARPLASRFQAAIEVRRSGLEKNLNLLTQELRQWSDRLILKETELRAALEKGTVMGSESVLSTSRRRTFLDFVYKEREGEARLAKLFKTIRGATNRTLDRLSRAESVASGKADAHPGTYEILKSQLVEVLRPTEKRYQTLRESALLQALLFEEGRTRLRWIYDTLQKTRVVDDASTRRTPLLERLFKI